MITRQPVVVATDFSAPGRLAVTRAARLASESGLPLIVVHAFNPFDRHNLPRLLDEFCLSLRSKASDNLTRLSAEMAGRYALPDVDCRIVDGRAAGAIAGNARDVDADLIVVGKRCGGPADERLLGSVTSNVMHHASCDVLMVP